MTSEQGRQVISYGRVSTARQAEEGVSLEAQEARAHAWATAHGHGPITHYHDDGLSGGRADNRPGLQAALDHARKAKGILLVYSLSRLARSVKDTLWIAESLDKAGADLVSLSESIDTSSAAGKMIFRILAVMAEFERDLASERTTMVLNHKRTKGEALGNVPFGFRKVGGNLVENDQEQHTINTVRAMFVCGKSYRAIVRELNAYGIPCRGSAWHLSSIQRILRRKPVDNACALA